MIKKGLILIVCLPFQIILGQKTLEQIIDEVPVSKNYYSPVSYYDKAGEKQGFSIHNETKVLQRLELEPLEHGEYYITGKYEINTVLVLFLSKYWSSEDTHFAILLDKSLRIIDRLEETSYSNDEGFYEVSSSIAYNIISTTTYNIYNNPEYVSKNYAITNKGFKPVKDQVIIKTPSGIRVREKPITHSPMVTSAANLSAFDYLSHHSEVDSISVLDNGKYLKNYWLAIAEKDSLQHLGYVFGAFAKRHIEVITNDYTIVFDEISKEEFDSKENDKKSNPPIPVITAIKEIKRLLKHQLIVTYEDGYNNIKKILADNGKAIGSPSQLAECGIKAYYPEYHYLVLECGHSSDYIINLKNGEDDSHRIGNPNYYLPSPQNTFRLNGYYSGQSNIYFLEKNNTDVQPEYILALSSLIPLEYIEKQFWTNDTTLFLKIENVFYKIQLQKI